MNLDPSCFKKSDQRITRSDHEYLAKNLGHDKIFKCTFCKRGFSSAQALGGHMNIHRKDRARLKEIWCENSLSMEINKTTDHGDSSPPELDSSTSHKPSFSSGTDHTKESCWPDKDDDSRVVEEDLIHDLPLFPEEPSVIGDGDEPGAENFEKSHVDKERGPSRAVSCAEVDLELRLGPEPDQDASAKK